VTKSQLDFIDNVTFILQPLNILRRMDVNADNKDEFDFVQRKFNFCQKWRKVFDSRGSVVKQTDLHLGSLGSTPAGTHESLVAAERASGQNCSCVPVQVLHIWVGAVD